jgi:UDPglucose 6-dehydrogenase
MNISVIGTGKLGLCTAACFASRGHRVIAVDMNERVIHELKAGRCPIKETGLEELLKRARVNLEFTTDTADSVMRSQVTMIIVPTPSGKDDRFSNEYVEAVMAAIAPAIRAKSEFHVVDVVSTVMPGSCDGNFRGLLEKLSGRVCGRDFGLVYNPEFIALGSVVHDFMRPDMVLIGSSDDRSTEMIRQIYLSTCENSPHIAAMSLLNAEIAKLSLNCFVTTKISFANELSAICERLPGADIDAITAALGHDSRIGNRYLRGGLGFAGTCFPRDNAAFQAFTKDAGYEANLSKATVAVNNGVIERIFNIISKKVPAGGSVVLLGLSYKPQTHIVEESQSITLAKKLAGTGYTVRVCDPQAIQEARKALGESVVYFENPYDGACGANAVVLLTCWPEYPKLDWDRLEAGVTKGAILIDCWRELKNRPLNRFDYVGLGLGQQAVR